MPVKRTHINPFVLLCVTLSPCMVVAQEATPPKIATCHIFSNLVSKVDADDAGRIAKEVTTLSIGIGLAWDNNGKVTKHRKLVIDSVETDRGEKLTPDLAAAAEERAVHSMVIGLNGHDANARETEIIVPLSAPTIRTQKIRRLTGSVEVDYFVGPKKQVVLGPVKNCLGKPVAVEGRPGVNIIVSRIDGGLDIQMPSAFMDSIEQITMTNAQGAELEAFNGSSNSQDGIIVAHCAVKMPDDGQVIVEYYTRSGSVRVPLNITDIRLPAILNIGADDRVASATALYRSFGLSCSD